MISKLPEKIKTYQHQVFLAVCIVLVSFISYNLGKINSGSESQLKITEGANLYRASVAGAGDPSISSGQAGEPQITIKTTPKPLDLRVVASKASDSKRYHYTWCGSWKRIKLENQLWFNSDKEAEAAGYALAGNCTK